MLFPRNDTRQCSPTRDLRGYFSSELIKALKKRKLDFVIRLKCDAFRGVRQFTDSTKLYLDVSVAGYSCRLVKYIIDGAKYVCITSLSGDSQQVQDLYKLRWKVEEHFKRLKTYLKVDRIRSKTVKTFYQDIEMRVFLDTLSLCIKPVAEPPTSIIQRLDTLFTPPLVSKVCKPLHRLFHITLTETFKTPSVWIIF